MYIFQKNMLGLYIKHIYIQYKLYEYKYLVYVCVFIYT